MARSGFIFDSKELWNKIYFVSRFSNVISYQKHGFNIVFYVA